MWRGGTTIKKIEIPPIELSGDMTTYKNTLF